jgi:uncharacterized protein YcbK (DUF882 family)
MRKSNPIKTADRRRLLQLLAAAPAVFAAGLRPLEALAGEVHPALLATRQLSMVSTHTGERLAIRYFEGGQYVPAALGQLNHLLRDHRTGDVSVIDPALFDRLHALAQCAQCEPHFEIISGYRSPATNDKLRESSSGVAKHSLHMEGRALDVRLAGASCAKLRDMALAMKAGGVGYYAKSNFVHLDTGRVRSWTG